MTMDRRVDLAITLVIITVGVLLLVMAQTVRHGSIDDPLREGGVPTAVALILIGGGGSMLVGQIRAWNDPELPAGIPDKPENGPASALRAGAVFLALTTWALTMPVLGYLIGTPIFMVVAMWLLNVRSVFKLVVVSIGFTLVTFLFFGQFIGVRLPPGFFRIGL